MCVLRAPRYAKIEEVDDAALKYTSYSLTPEIESMLLKCLCNLTGLKGNQTRMIEEGLVSQVRALLASASAC
jgi:hypothetical protein